LILIVGLVFLAFFLIRRRRQNNSTTSAATPTPAASAYNNETAYDPTVSRPAKKFNDGK